MYDSGIHTWKPTGNLSHDRAASQTKRINTRFVIDCKNTASSYRQTRKVDPRFHRIATLIKQLTGSSIQRL
jgi:hypothetical protein